MTTTSKMPNSDIQVMYANITFSVIALAWLAASKAKAEKDDMHPAGPVAG
jgi:hypothetical protein